MALLSNSIFVAYDTLKGSLKYKKNLLLGPKDWMSVVRHPGEF